MTDNTPLNADDELRESILEDIYNAAVWREHLGAVKGEDEFGDKDRHKDRLEGSGRVADLVMNKILADSKKHELQARIGELGWAKTASVWNIDIRLAELEQELEKL